MHVELKDTNVMSLPKGNSFITHFTLRRVFVWAFLLSLFALAVRQCSSIDWDFWWHLKAGQYIIQSKGIPHVDPFSFTRAGAEWITHEWLSEVMMYAVFRAGGWIGLFLLFGTTITAAWGICFQRCKGKPFIAAFAVVFAAAASASLFGFRPQMFTLLLASIFIALLDGYIYGGKRRVIWLLPALMLLWVNLHAGFALGLALILLFVVMAGLDREWKRIKPLLLNLAICLAVVPLNPNGFRMFSYPFETLSAPAMQSFIQEWFSPDFHQFRFLPLAALILATFSAMALSPTRPRPGELFALVALSFAALRSGRHIPIFAIFAAPLFAKYLAHWISAKTNSPITLRSAPATGSNIVLTLALLLLPTFIIVQRVGYFSSNVASYEAQKFPVGAADFIEKQEAVGPIFNDYNWGGYLIWKLYPSRRVFIDGRADVYGDGFIFEYLRTYGGERGWRNTLDRFEIQTVLVQPNSALTNLLREDKGWRKVFEDEQAVVFARN
jgi:hypothetical protein